MMKRVFQNVGPAVCNINLVVCIPLFPAWLCTVWPTDPVSRPHLLIEPMFKIHCSQMTPYGKIDFGKHLLMLWLCTTLGKYGFPESMTINKVHSLAKLHTTVLETHSPADSTQPGNLVLNCKSKSLFKISLFLERMDNINVPKQDVL